jgi:drug/metabolite transporter (DMT)-like permease
VEVKAPDRLTITMFTAMVLSGGLNAIGVHFTVMELPPFWGATIRFGPAALLLFLLVFLQKLPLPSGRALYGALLFGLLNFGGSYAFLYWGLLEVQAGLAQVILALVPLLTLLFAIAYRQEVFHWRSMIGSLLAVTGIALVFGIQLNADVPFLSLLAILLGGACFAASSVLVKSFPQSHPITTNAVGMAVGTLLLYLMSIMWQETPILPTQPATWIALAYLILIGSCLTFILVLAILKRWTASATSYAFVLFPIVTILASAWLTGETISPSLLVGGLLVLAGVYVGVLAPGAGRQPVQEKDTSIKEAPV